MSFPKHVTLVEVGPRDGLQNENLQIPTQTKIEFINRLSETGLRVIETTSFVSAKRIPQLKDAAEVYSSILKKNNIRYPVLIPNTQGMQNALKAEAKHIAVLTAASNTFCQKNIECNIEESLMRISEVLQLAKQHTIPVRGYISCALGCPYEGKIDKKIVQTLAERLYTMGCYEISLGDTIGVGTPFEARQCIDCVAEKVPIESLAIHFHDTYGQALANIYACLEAGVSVIDSSIAGLGGCPYAKGASGNVATEDVLYMLNGLGIETGVEMDRLLEVTQFVAQFTGHSPRSKVALAKLVMMI